MVREWTDPEWDEPDDVSDLQATYESDVAVNGQDFTEAAATTDAAHVTAAQPFATEQHHWFAQQYRDEYAEMGINVDDFVTDLDKDNHQQVEHPMFEGYQSRNPEQFEMFETAEREGRDVTRDEAVQGVLDHMEATGWDPTETHGYRDHTEATSVLDLVSPEPETEAAEGVSEAGTAADTGGTWTAENTAWSSYETSEADDGFWTATDEDVEAFSSFDPTAEWSFESDLDPDTEASTDTSFDTGVDSSVDSSADDGDADGGDGGGDGGGE